MKSISLFRHVNNSLNPYRWAISIVVAVLVSVLFAGVALKSRLNADKEMVEALSPYLSALVESSDRPEMLRVVQSIASVKKSDVVVVQDGTILATNRELSELDTFFTLPKIRFQIFDTNFTSTQIVTIKEIRRVDHSSLNSQIYIFSPLLSSLQNIIGIFIMTFIVCILISFISANQTRKAIKKALRPMDQLHHEIRGLLFEEETESTPIQIKELEEIRNTVNSTKIDLENAKDRLAEEKAKKLSADSYKRLIHDLHNPVAALRQMSRISNDGTLNTDVREEAAQSIPRIADQILSQVTAAKKNLEEEPVALRELNLLSCVKEGVTQTATQNKKVVSIFNSEDLIIPHDPSLLKRAIVNLLENGIEAATSTVRVTVSKNDEGAFIKICDDGPGMDESKIPIYFQGRGQSGKANRQAFGLSSTNHIVRSHGGKLIYRKSDLGGSSFEIRLGVV